MCFEAEQAWRKVSEWCTHCILPTYLSTKKAANETMSIAHHWWDHAWLSSLPSHCTSKSQMKTWAHDPCPILLHGKQAPIPPRLPTSTHVHWQARQTGGHRQEDKHSAGPPQTRYYCEKKDLNNVVCLSHWCSIEKTCSCLSSDYHSMFILP